MYVDVTRHETPGKGVAWAGALGRRSLGLEGMGTIESRGQGQRMLVSGRPRAPGHTVAVAQGVRVWLGVGMVFAGSLALL